MRSGDLHIHHFDVPQCGCADRYLDHIARVRDVYGVGLVHVQEQAPLCLGEVEGLLPDGVAEGARGVQLLEWCEGAPVPF